MFPAWALIGGIVAASIGGFTAGLLWVGRPSRSQHSFYDPAVSVDATIERVNAEVNTTVPYQPDVSRLRLRPDERQDHDSDNEPSVGEITDMFSTVDARPCVPVSRSTVRYYFAESSHELPGGASPVPNQTRRSSGFPRHALREETTK